MRVNGVRILGHSRRRYSRLGALKNGEQQEEVDRRLCLMRQGKAADPSITPGVQMGGELGGISSWIGSM
jgi:hypothetical protein